jgi:hypothetical protein
MNENQEQRKQIIDKLIYALQIGANGHVYFKNKKKGGKTELMVYTNALINDYHNVFNDNIIENEIQQEQPLQEQPPENERPKQRPQIRRLKRNVDGKAFNNNNQSNHLTEESFKTTYDPPSGPFHSGF